MTCVEELPMLKAEKITRMQLNASHISALIGMSLLSVFVILMYLLHSVRAYSRRTCICEMYLVWILNS